MESSFRLTHGDARSRLALPSDVQEDMMQRLSEMLCRECGGNCAGFLVTAELDRYQAHVGPKIGWAVNGQEVFLRLANCKAVSRIDQITQFLKLYGYAVAESQYIQ